LKKVRPDHDLDFARRLERPWPVAPAREPTVREARAVGVAGVRSATPVAREHVTVDLNVDARPLEAVVAEIASRSGWNVAVAPGVHETVSLSLRSTTRDLLEILAKMTHCDLEDEYGILWFTQPATVTLEATNAPLGEVLERIALQSGENVVVPSGLTKTVSVGVKDLNWLRALWTVAQASGLAVELHDGVYTVK
jgi:type II secretory pathway component HofQ